MYIERFKKGEKIYFGFFTDSAEYFDQAEVPSFLRDGSLTAADIQAAEAEQKERALAD